MKALDVVLFRKTGACPSEAILVSYTSKKLAHEIMTLVKFHLGSCDFCSAEVSLLSHYSHPTRRESKAPDIPMNLRVLAESVFSQNNKVTVEDDEPDLILH